MSEGFADARLAFKYFYVNALSGFDPPHLFGLSEQDKSFQARPALLTLPFYLFALPGAFIGLPG